MSKRFVAVALAVVCIGWVANGYGAQRDSPSTAQMPDFIKAGACLQAYVDNFDNNYLVVAVRGGGWIEARHFEPKGSSTIVTSMINTHQIRRIHYDPAGAPCARLKP